MEKKENKERSIQVIGEQQKDNEEEEEDFEKILKLASASLIKHLSDFEL